MFFQIVVLHFTDYANIKANNNTGFELLNANLMCCTFVKRRQYAHVFFKFLFALISNLSSVTIPDNSPSRLKRNWSRNLLTLISRQIIKKKKKTVNNYYSCKNYLYHVITPCI